VLFNAWFYCTLLPDSVAGSPVNYRTFK